MAAEHTKQPRPIEQRKPHRPTESAEPAKQRNTATYVRLEACKFRITWEVLYTKIYRQFCGGVKPLDEFAFIKELFPRDFLGLFLDKNGIFQNKYASCVCRATDDAAPRFAKARDYLLGLRTSDGEIYHYDTCPVILAFEKKWRELLPLLASDNLAKKQKLAFQLEVLLTEIPEEELEIYRRINPLYEEENFSLILAILSVMASTLFHYRVSGEKRNSSDSDLYNLVLPPLTSVSKEVSDNLIKARALLNTDDYSLEDYQKLLTYSLKSSSEKREAQYLLYKKAVRFDQGAGYQKFLVEAANAGYEPAQLQQKNEEAKALLKKVLDIYEDSKVSETDKAAQCCRYCENILRLVPSAYDKYKGPAAFILYQYSLAGHYTAPSGETAFQFLEISHRCGYLPAENAREKYHTNGFSITPAYVRGKASTPGTCYFNTDNLYAAAFQKTIPETWRQVLCDFHSPDFAGLIRQEALPKKILLLDDHFEKNLSDLLHVLQTIKDAAGAASNGLATDGFDLDNPLNLEIFIRHNSDTARSLIDTAVSHLGEHLMIPIYLINDEKRAADQLLSRHPLFFPLTGIKFPTAQTAQQERPLLNFVVVGTSGVAEWLIREAFWLMGDKDNAFRTRITLLDPQGERFIVQLKSKFPGLVKSSFQIKDIELPEILGKDVAFDSNELLAYVAEILQETPYCYFAVATPNDDYNLSLAMRLRESCIRTCIRNSLTSQLNNPIPIAFLCRQEELASLSRTMVIEKEKFGNRWFNTWALIPFGEVSACYSWSELAGGTFEKLALCIHYQYSGIPAERTQELEAFPGKLSEMPEGVKKAYAAKRDFFCHQYNMDSSFSLAISLPYRLFQFEEKTGVRIFPIAWSILDGSVFANAQQLEFLSKRIKDFFLGEKDWKKIAEWEHSRWVKWMLSRGWLPCSFEESVFAFQNGNPRQQLFVARFHPCICSYSDLKALQNFLLQNCGIKKDFYTADLTNVKATKQLLSLEWLYRRTAEPAR